MFQTSEETLREIIGLAKKSNWNKVKECIKFIVQKTLKKKAGYRLTALNVSINGKKQSDYNTLKESRENIKDIDSIIDFNHFSLYQSTHISNNLIEISQNNGTIVFLAKYMGPSLNNYQTFDFSVHLDAVNDPFFTNGTDRKLNGSEILKIINNKEKIQNKIQKEKLEPDFKKLEKIKSQDIEAFVFEKITGKNAIWNRSETKAFKYWKAIAVNKYRKETGKTSHYKGKLTQGYKKYLSNIKTNN